jgi:mRNA interferase RelE/StbE
MASYRLEISRTAERLLRALPRDDQKRVARAMIALADQPFPRGSRKLHGHDDVFRIRVRQYRVIYSVGARTLTIIGLKIGHRNDVYR